MKIVVRIGIVFISVFVLFVAFLIYREANSREFVPGDDEIALFVQLNTKEDIGLLVFDYDANGSKHSGGISNADKSLLKHDDRLIIVCNKEEMNCLDDMVEMSIQFRIITEYVEPNYENIYPDNLIMPLEPISFRAHFGESNFFTISGDGISGYHIRMD